MTLCVFALIASEFLPVSLLTPMARDLRVSEGLIGYGMAISGAFAVVASLCIAPFSGSMNRKVLLLALTALMGVSGAVVALAQNYETYMIGRALIGVVVGGFWSMSAAVAMRLVPPEDVAKAMAIFNSGNALATVIAAPLGSYLGGVIGWRGAFFCLVPVAAVALVWQWVTLPAMQPEKGAPSFRIFFSLFKRSAVSFGMLAVGVFFMGQFVLFTYVRPYLETVTQVDLPTLSTILLVMGIAGFIGTSLIGLFLKSSVRLVLSVIPLSMASIAIALVLTGSSVVAAFLLLGLWGLVATAAPVGWWLWLARTLPADAEAGGGLMVATIQLSIALGSTLGGLLFDGSGYRVTFFTSAALLVIAAGLALAATRGNPAEPAL
ncbi:MFS transporter [Ottowia thiooxydans]|uniref:MFS transporter n=1 Tax=Ottowia thiooxydans TaxID=219182 RepID=UPI0012EB9796